ncbi:hypothetical protein BvCmsSIP006_03983 [Escherichia coli]|nr:hypothetical protein BvCmsSIP006_03983 [Escherichia coli]
MRFSSVSIVYGITLSQADTSNAGVVRNIDVTFDIKIHCQPKANTTVCKQTGVFFTFNSWGMEGFVSIFGNVTVQI